MRIHVCNDEQSPVPPRGFQGIVVTTWGLLDGLLPKLLALRPQLLIADEAHYAKNAGTEGPDGRGIQRADALARLAAASPRCLLLTGTPMENNAQELFRLLRILDPRVWNDEAPFKGMRADEIDDAEEANSPLQRRIRQYMIRRLKKDVFPEMAAKQYEEVLVELPPAAMVEYQEVEKRFLAWFTRMIQARATMLANKGTDARTIEQRINAAIKGEALVRLQVLRKIVGVFKIPAAMRWIRKKRAEREPVLVFAEHQEVLLALSAQLESEGIKWAKIDGRTPKKKRLKAADDFQQERADVMLGSKAACEGLTLHRACYVLQVERWWTPTKEDQGADRLHRRGQKRDVVVTRIHVRGTIDQRLDSLNTEKRKIIERVVDARGGA